MWCDMFRLCIYRSVPDTASPCILISSILKVNGITTKYTKQDVTTEKENGYVLMLNAKPKLHKWKLHNNYCILTLNLENGTSQFQN